MKNKYLGVAMAASSFVGVPFCFLLLGKLYGLYAKFFGHVWPVQEWPNGDKLYPAIALICLPVSILVFICFLIETFSKENKDETKHICDICGDKVKKGEGKHYKKLEEDCYCVCGTCAPTHSIQ